MFPAMSKPSQSSYQRILLCIALAVLAALPFLRAVRFDFVNYDDDQMIYDNPDVNQGLTPQSLRWAVWGRQMGHWHPVTSLTHVLDVELFGLNAGGHHAVNVLIHMAATALLFLALARMSAHLWPAAAVAMLFALHPQHVEPVAWVSGRKDILCGMFMGLTLLAYAWYVEQRSWRRYALVFASYTLGLMSKSMLVTLPCVMLLLDYWPLRRLTSPFENRGRVLAALALEKAPLLAPMALVAYLTYASAASLGIAGGAEFFPASVRLQNAILAYGQYLLRTVWPFGLASFYPHPGAAVTLWKVGLSAAVMALVSAAVLTQWRRRPYLVVGWLWFVGTLVPVAGFFQSLHFATADKYTYIPLVGLFIMAAWGVPELLAALIREPQARARVLMGLGAVCTVILAVLSWRQAGYWRDSATLARHTVSVTKDNAVMHNNLGMALMKEGRTDEALVHFSQALRISDYYARAHYNMAAALAQQGRIDEAIAQYNRAIEANPKDVPAFYNLGNVLERKGRIDEAVQAYRKAIAVDPDHIDARYNLANALSRMNKADEAIHEYREVIRIEPSHAQAHNNLGIALAQQGDYAAAAEQFLESVRLDPSNAEAYNNLGAIRLRQGDDEEAIKMYAKALEIDPNHPTARANIDRLRRELGKRTP